MLNKEALKITDLIMASEAEAEPTDFLQCTETGIVLASGKKWELDVPVTFQWMPGGVTTIYPHYNGKPIELTVQADETTAQVVQASYENWFKLRPKGTPFGCVEHREEEAAIRLPKDVAAFEWREAKDGQDAGIYCTAMPTELGAKNVNGRIHSSWSPSFRTDAEYNKTTKKGDVLVFAKGARGSKENPAKVIGVAYSVGSLTNKPAFRNISPVRAKEAKLEGDVEVEANWSDKAREAALEARKMHGRHCASCRSSAYAHEASQYAHTATLSAMDEGTARSHKEAAYAHERAADRHQETLEHHAGHVSAEHDDHAAEHRSLALKHHEESNRLFKKERKSIQASESEQEEEVVQSKETSEKKDGDVYSRLGVEESDMDKINAKFGVVEEPTLSVYDRLGVTDSNAQPAERN